MDRYVGLDAHATSCTFGVIDAKGKQLGSHVVETNGKALVEFIRTQAGTLHVCMEEGIQSAWLYEIFAPHVDELFVVPVAESKGPKNDARDALALAERMRTGSVKTGVYKAPSHGEEVAAARGKPARAVWGEPAARHDRMHVRMEGQVARPGVEHQGDAQLGAEARRVAAELEQRRRRCGEEPVEDRSPVVRRERPQLRR